MATLYILYGSATGNAEGIAKDLAERELPKTFSNAICQPLESFKKLSKEWEKPPSPPLEAAGQEIIKKHGIILISSTTGNGDAPENASRFVRYIKRKQTAESQPFQHCTVAVLGLGDTNYDQFCAVGKILDKKMVELGATRAKALACADEATGLEDVVEPWIETVLNDVEKACIMDGGNDDALLYETTAERKRNKGQRITETVPPSTPSTTATSTTPVTPTTTTTATTNSVPTEQEPTSEVVEASTSSSSPLFILYGSATGNAEQIAKDLAATYETILGNPDSKTFFPSVTCCECDQFKKKCLETWEKEPEPTGTKHGVIIVASTTGNGDAPENAGRFMRYIKRKQTADVQPFRHVQFAVLGLGDTNYDQFCNTGKTIDKKLLDLGGTRAMPLACADEATGLEDVVEPWTDKVLMEITNACRRHTVTTTTTTTSTITNTTIKENKEVEEEKKSEAIEPTDTNNVQRQGSKSSLSVGLSIVRSMLCLEECQPMAKCDLSSLPALRGSRSSCELFQEGGDTADNAHELTASSSASRRRSSFDERATISTSSSGSLHYTMDRPFEANIQSARYLTKSSVEGATCVCESLGPNSRLVDDDVVMQARDVLNAKFPLLGSDDCVERNGKRVIEMSLSLPDDYTLEYQPGDALGLLVTNTPPAVKFVLEMLQTNHGLLPSQLVSIDSDRPITIEEAIRERMDLCCVIKNRRLLFSLAQFCSDQEEINALHLLSSKTEQGERLFQEFIVNQRRSVVDILREFPSCQNIPLEGLLSILPPIAPRYYSICSSPLDKKDEMDTPSLSIAFSVVDYLTPSLIADQKEHGLRRIQGVATGYLETLCSPFLCNLAGRTELPTVKIFPKPTAEFRMPSNLSTPLILIGPGTGIAPFMGFLAHRRALVSSRESTDAANTVVEGTWRGGYELEAEDLPIGDKDASGLLVGADFRSQQEVGDVSVFFGCRYADHDYLYRDELKSLNDEKIITSMYSAFSRDADCRQYVQDVMKTNEDCKKKLIDMITTQNASVYICGDGNHMARDVQNTIADLIGPHVVGSSNNNNCEEYLESGKAYIDDMKRKGKFLLDIWS